MPERSLPDTPENFDINRILARIERRWDSSLLDKDKQIDIWNDNWMIGETDGQQDKATSE